MFATSIVWPKQLEQERSDCRLQRQCRLTKTDMRSASMATIAGTEYAVQTNLAQYEDVAELEDDILCFLPTVSDLDVFGCELDLLDLHTQRPLPEAFCTVLLQRPKLQIVVRSCMVDGHSIWQFQADGRESYPKAIRVPANPRGEIADRAFCAAPVLRQ